MRIYIVRHGETDLNTRGCLNGRIDSKLTENGIELAKITGEGLKDIHFDYVLSSMSSRAMITAQLILAANDSSKNAPIYPEPRLLECAFGPWEGLCTRKDNYELTQDNWQDFFLKPFEFRGPEGVETLGELCVRAGELLDEIIAKEGKTDKTILFSTHGCTTRALLNRFYDDPSDYWQGRCPYNCAVNIIEVKDGVAKHIGKDLIYYDESLCEDMYPIDKV